MGDAKDKSWLLLDATNLCHRARHSMEGKENGMTYGFLREVTLLRARFGTSDMAFCFDHGQSIREKEHLWYRAARNLKKASLSIEEKLDLADFYREVRLLKTEVLFDIGFRNVFFQKGFEADDLIASLVKNVLGDQKIIIVSSDKDFYQLLSRKVKIYKPTSRILYTREDFEKEYVLTPSQWILLQCIAGCRSDGVPGVEGVGEQSAAKFLNGTLNESGLRYQKILEEEKTWKTYLDVVRLPHPRTRPPTIRQDETTIKKWEVVVNRLHLPGLMDVF